MTLIVPKDYIVRANRGRTVVKVEPKWHVYIDARDFLYIKTQDIDIRISMIYHEDLDLLDKIGFYFRKLTTLQGALGEEMADSDIIEIFASGELDVPWESVCVSKAVSVTIFDIKQTTNVIDYIDSRIRRQREQRESGMKKSMFNNYATDTDAIIGDAKKFLKYSGIYTQENVLADYFKKNFNYIKKADKDFHRYRF